MMMFLLGMVLGAVTSIAVEHKVWPTVKDQLKQFLGD